MKWMFSGTIEYNPQIEIQRIIPALEYNNTRPLIIAIGGLVLARNKFNLEFRQKSVEHARATHFEHAQFDTE